MQAGCSTARSEAKCSHCQAIGRLATKKAMWSWSVRKAPHIITSHDALLASRDVIRFLAKIAARICWDFFTLGDRCWLLKFLLWRHLITAPKILNLPIHRLSMGSIERPVASVAHVTDSPSGAGAWVLWEKFKGSLGICKNWWFCYIQRVLSLNAWKTGTPEKNKAPQCCNRPVHLQSPGTPKPQSAF